MKEETTNTIQIRCYDCDSFKTQLILIEREEDFFTLYVLCLNCGLYQTLCLPRTNVINFEYKTKPQTHEKAKE